MKRKLKRKLYKTYKQTAEHLLPVKTTRDFKQSGMITPEQFVESGDYLVEQFPLWSWASVSKRKQKSYLPPHKQMLILQRIPVNELELSETTLPSMTSDQDEWSCITQPQSSIETKSKNIVENIVDDEFEDLGEIEDMEEDEACLSMNEHNFIQSRTYTITITYDNYYRTPRMWFLGYDTNGSPLSYDSMMEDLSNDHKKVTATMDSHPFYELQWISIHPCKHAYMMKQFIQMELSHRQSAEQTLTVQFYFIYFLKFMGCIIPCVNFDYTMNT